MLDWITVLGSLMSMMLTVGLSIVFSLVLLFITWKTVVAFVMQPTTGAERLVGMTGIAATDIAPHGTVLADGTRWQAKTEGENIREGETVEIVAVEKLQTTVRKAEA